MSIAVADTQPVEELALFNAAFLALLVRRAADEHERRSGGRALPAVLAYLALPLALHGLTRRTLPNNVTAQMGEWIRSHPEAAAGLDERVRALRPLVSAGLRLGLTHGLLVADQGDLRANTLSRRPRGMARSTEVDECIDKAGFLGRWLSEQPDPVTTLALWGLRS
ncbi:MAG: three component ABC system middle component [Solirubrobacteraceae bacterium]